MAAGSGDGVRSLTRLLAAVVGLVLLVGGLAVALEVALTSAAGHHVLLPYDRWLRYGEQHAWSQQVLKVTGLVLLVVGVLMLIATVRRLAPLAIAGSSRSQLQVTFARKPLEGALGRLAVRDGGLESVKVRVRKGKVVVAGASLATDLERARVDLGKHVGSGLHRLPLAKEPSVDVKLRKADA